MAFMAAFHVDGKSAGDTGKNGIFRMVLDQPGGRALLFILTAGLFCYALWRFLQCFLDTEHKGKDLKGIARRIVYFFSACTYTLVALYASRLLLEKAGGGGKDAAQSLIERVLSHANGEWLIGLAAVIIAGIGLQQVNYGVSGKFKKHVDQQDLPRDAAAYVLRAGKIGYVARGTVWLVLALVVLRAALFHQTSDTGSTSGAFTFLQQMQFGTWLVAALGFGLLCYGVMNFVRAFYGS
jgi:hypothetical protein